MVVYDKHAEQYGENWRWETETDTEDEYDPDDDERRKEWKIE